VLSGVSFRPPFDEPPGLDDEAPLPDDLRVWSRIENLLGEERRLLAIAHASRSPHQHDRLRSIGDELDQAFEALRERAERLSRHRTQPKTSEP
jgi:hypothetical protein